MESFAEIKKLFDFSIPDMINEIMLELNDEIIELNQVEQLSEGIDALGQRIRTISATEENESNVYSNFTIFKRGAEGLQTDNVDLKVTGRLWSTFKLIKVKNGWEIIVDWSVNGEDVREHFDSKFDFAGLTDDNIEYLVNTFVFPKLEKRILKQIGL